MGGATGISLVFYQNMKGYLNMKVFISQPMRGKSDEYVIETRNRAIEKIKKIYGESVEIIDSFFKGYPASESKNPGVFYLSKSIACLAEADVAYFCKDWTRTRGCRLEYDIARAYGIKIDGEEI